LIIVHSLITDVKQCRADTTGTFYLFNNRFGHYCV